MGPFVHLRAFGEVVILAVLTHQEIESAGVLHRVPHHGRVHHANAVVAYPNRARIAQVRHLGELGAFLPLGDGAKGQQPRATMFRGARDHHLCDRAGIVRRLRVRHRANRGETASRRGVQTGADVFFVLLARLAKVHV